MVERNEKKKKKGKKKFGTEPGWLLPIEHEAGLGVLGAGRRRAWLAHGRARRACWRRAWAQARARQAAEARRRWGGRRAGARQGEGRAAGQPGRGLGVQLGQVGCFGAPDSVFGPVRLGSFLSHQMNTVHCKIFFRKKKIFIKFN